MAESGLLHSPVVDKIEDFGNCVLRFHFDGKKRDIDISALNLAKRYPKLKDPNYAGKAYFENGCIKWPEGGPWIDTDELENISEAKLNFKHTKKISF